MVISCAAEVIARHPRSYEQEDFVFDPLHYLSLLEQKTNALDQAAHRRLYHGGGFGPRAHRGQDEKRLLRFQKQLAKYKLLIIDELGFVPLSKTGAELLFEVFMSRTRFPWTQNWLNRSVQGGPPIMTDR